MKEKKQAKNTGVYGILTNISNDEQKKGQNHGANTNVSGK